MTGLTEAQLRAHPELAMLVSLAGQLELLPTLFASVHDGRRADAMVDQARSMARGSRLLIQQLEAYVALAELGDDEKKRRR